MKSTKSVLIVGGGGFIGTHIARRLREKYKVFLGFHRHPYLLEGTTPVPIDALDRDSVKKVIYMVRPEIIVYAAGSNDVAWAEEHNRDADRIHAGGSVNVITISDVLQPRFIFLSNNYVFDGRKGNYTEKDIVLPFNALGKAKLSAENFIRSRSLNHVIIRSPPVFGRGNVDRPSFFDELRIKLAHRQRIELSSLELHSFAPIFGLVSLVERLVEGGPRNRVLHYGGLTKMSHYDFGRAVATTLGYDPGLVVEKPIPPTYKPHQWDFSLNFSEAAQTLKVDALILEQGFDLLKKHLVRSL